MTRYDCGGCSFATTQMERMVGHEIATGHKAAPDPVADRRQRAREALLDTRAAITSLPAVADPVEVAIETATRVKVTDEVVTAAQAATNCDPAECDGCMRAALETALRVLGFEVEQ